MSIPSILNLKIGTAYNKFYIPGLSKSLPPRPGNGIVRQYKNAKKIQTAGGSAAIGWTAAGLGTLARTLSENSVLSGCGTLCSALMAKEGYNTYKGATRVMKKLKPEYSKIVERANKIKANVK